MCSSTTIIRPHFHARYGGEEVVSARTSPTPARKIDNVLVQARLAKCMGKRHVIAETGAGQHGLATATACALLGLDCIVNMARSTSGGSP